MKRLRAFLSVVLIASSASAQTPSPVSIKKSVKPAPITRDITVIGWVRGDTITLPTGANIILVGQLGSATTCGQQLELWRSGRRSNINSDTDRRYANAFLLKNSPNVPPPNTINPQDVANGGDYRLFSRAKVEYRVQNGQVFGSPRFIYVEPPIVGKTPEPCSGAEIIWIAGDDHLQNGARGTGVSNSVVYQLNEGRIGLNGQQVDRTLNECTELDCIDVPVGPTTPWIWSLIKFDVNGDLILPLDKQIFPTYSVYRERQLLSVLAQSDPETFISLDATSQRVTGDIQ